MDKSIITNPNGQKEMTLFSQKSDEMGKTNVAEGEPANNGMQRTRNSKEAAKSCKDKLNDCKEKAGNFVTDIRKYFGKNSPEENKLEDDKHSNVFSFMMATRREQDEAIRELQAKELNEAEELLPNIMKSIPKEQLLANFISKAARTGPVLPMLVDSHQDREPMEQEVPLLNNSTEPSGVKVTHSVLSSSMFTSRKSKSVSFSNSVQTIEIVKEPDEDTREFIMDSELNKAKEMSLQETVSDLINIKLEDTDIDIVFKDEIEQCLKASSKRKKSETKPKNSVKKRNCATSNYDNDFMLSNKENANLNNKCQTNISNFFIKSKVNSKASNSQIGYDLNIHDVTSNLPESGTNISNSVHVNKDKAENISPRKDVMLCDKDDNIIILGDSSNSCSSVTNHFNCIDLNITSGQDHEKEVCQVTSGQDHEKEVCQEPPVLKLFRSTSCQDYKQMPVTLRRSQRVPKKRQLDDIFNGSWDATINDQPAAKKSSRTKESNTPKRDAASKTRKDQRTPMNQDSDEDSPIEIIEIKTAVKSSKDKSTRKLASIFLKKDEKSVPEVCPIVSKARREFLFAETPAVVQIKQSIEEQVVTWPTFPLYNHIHQSSADPIWALPEIQLPLLNEVLDTKFDYSDACKQPLQYMRNKNQITNSAQLQSHPPIDQLSVHNVLYHLKAKNPNFPVFSVFNNYLSSKIDFVELFAKEPSRVVIDENFDNCSTVIVRASKRKRPTGRLSSSKRARTNDTSQSEAAWQKWIPYSWTRVFAPRDTSHVIENEGVKFQLKEWLEQWKYKSELEDAKDKPDNKHKDSGDNSNSYDSDDELVNTVLLSGMPGVGKTSLVYALGQELGIEVLEINASTRRQGKQVMTQLSEATQSHTVSSGNGISIISPLGTNLTPLAADSSAKKCKSKSSRKVCDVKDPSDSQDGADKKKNMALILFEDIDIVFEDYDDGFMSAVSNFMATTKRPIILTCNQPRPPIKSKIRGNFIEVEMNAPTPACAANYLQLMCLANSVFLNAREVEHLIAVNRGDIRKSILELQFWALSGSSSVQWLKMEKSKLTKTPSNDQLLEGDAFPSHIFSKLGNRKSADVPISDGCMWSKSELPLLSAIRRDHKQLRNLDWALLGGNLLTLLPFSYKHVHSDIPKYPLSPRDPCIRHAYEFHKYSWLATEDELDEVTPDLPKPEEKIEVSPEAKTASTHIIDSMANLFDMMCDLDVLEGPKSDAGMRCHYLAALDDTSDETAISLHNSELISELAKAVFNKENSAVTNCLNSCKLMEDCLKANIKCDNPAILLKAHQHWNDSDAKVITDLNDKVSSKVPLICHPNRSGVTMDYLPFIRTVARQDQLGQALKKFKRSSRYLSHLNMMGYYLNPEDCISIANFLT